MDVELLLAIALRCAHFSGLSEETIALVMGGQLETLLAGEAAIDAGPAPGPAATTLSPAESRTVSLLSGAGGCMLGGGDPAQSLELALLAVADSPDGGSRSPLAGLIEESRTSLPGSDPGTGPGPDAGDDAGRRRRGAGRLSRAGAA